MNPEITELAGTAATTLVQLLTADGWQRVKERFAAFWGRAQPERADVIAGELDVTREELLTAQRDDDPESVMELGTWVAEDEEILAGIPG